MRQLAIVLLAMIASPISAQVIPTERFLVPIYSPHPTPGAFGSRWVSELRILNTGSTTASIENFGVVTSVGFTPEPLPPNVEINGNRLNGAPSVVNPGALLYVRPEFAQQLKFGLRVRNVSAEQDVWGPWLPVVHESRGFVDEAHFLDIPVNAQYRAMLRLYTFDQAFYTVRVRIYGTRADERSSSVPDALLADFPLLLRASGAVGQPAYAEVSNLYAAANAEGYDRMRVAVEREGQFTFAFWGMISVTNNITQHVTIVVPNDRSHGQ